MDYWVKTWCLRHDLNGTTALPSIDTLDVLAHIGTNQGQGTLEREAANKRNKQILGTCPHPQAYYYLTKCSQ